ncbi:MAG: hypothetical protein F6K45_01440 [Kamptonema sp. SIO1D9]|nr:hypothetical protein [Kamptonema sp. SIO1D9]
MTFKNSISENEYNKLIETLSYRQKELERRITIDEVRGTLREMGLLELLRENDIKEVRKEVNREFKGQQRRKYFISASILTILVASSFTFMGYKLATFLAFKFPDTAANLPPLIRIEVNTRVQIIELKEELENRKEEIQEKERKIDELQDEVNTLENQLKDEREKISAKEEIINKLQKEKTILQEKLAALNNKPEELIPTANLKPDKERYTDLENIFVNFSFENIDYAEGYIIQLVPSNRPVSYSSRPRIDVGKNDKSVEFTPRTPGNYEIRAYINTGTQWKLIQRKPIEVTEVPEYKVE